MATVIQYDKDVLFILIGKVQADPSKLGELITFLKAGVQYDGAVNSIIAVGNSAAGPVKNISLTAGVTVEVKKNMASDVHELFIDNSFTAKLSVKVPPRQG